MTVSTLAPGKPATLMVQAAAEQKDAEITFQCPVCLTVETLFLEKGMLVATQHWKYYRGMIYHRNCGKPANPVGMMKSELFLASSTSIMLARTMKENNETATQMAARLGVNRITIKRWLEGKCNPNNISTSKLSNTLKIPAGV